MQLEELTAVRFYLKTALWTVKPPSQPEDNWYFCQFFYSVILLYVAGYEARCLQCVLFSIWRDMQREVTNADLKLRPSKFSNRGAIATRAPL